MSMNICERSNARIMRPREGGEGRGEKGREKRRRE